MQVTRWTRLKSKSPIECRRFCIDRVDQHGSRSHNVRSSYDARQRIFEHGFAQPQSLLIFINRKPCQENHGNWMMSKAPCDPRGCFLAANAPRCDRVIGNNAPATMHHIRAR